jgi:iron-sulfur cluster assembly protein
MSVTLTEKAAFRLRNFLQGNTSDDKPTVKGVRVAVTNGGCNGYEYALNITSKPNANDLVFEQDKVRIYIDPQSAPLLDGIVIDFVDSLTQSGFVFNNPNATETCGCGKSFGASGCNSSAESCK